MNTDDNLLVRRGLQQDQACRRRTQCSPHQLLTNPLLPPSFQQQSVFQRFQQLSCVQLSDLTSCRLDATTSASAAVAVEADEGRIVSQSSTSMLSSLNVAKYAFSLLSCISERTEDDKIFEKIFGNAKQKNRLNQGWHHSKAVWRTDQIEMGNRSYGEIFCMI